jgi:hypothetical protein
MLTTNHSPNTRENGYMREWLADIVTGFQKDATERGVPLDVIGHDETTQMLHHNWFTPSKAFFINLCQTLIFFC